MKLLIVEDKKEEQEIVRNLIPDATIATTFREFKIKLGGGQFEGILTDLYFPNGYDKESETYIKHRDETVKAIKSYITKCNQSTPFANAAESVTGLKCEDNLEKMITILNELNMIKTKEEINLLRTSAKNKLVQDNFYKLQKGIQEGTELMPEGIFVTQIARANSIPCIIVTSEFHHGIKFQPLREMIKGRYTDDLIDGRKNWERGLKLLNYK